MSKSATQHACTALHKTLESPPSLSNLFMLPVVVWALFHGSSGDTAYPTGNLGKAVFFPYAYPNPECESGRLSALSYHRTGLGTG